MDDRKQIQIDTEYLHGKKSYQKKKKNSEKKAQVLNVSNASVKELLLEKLRQYRKQKKKQNEEVSVVPQSSVVTSEFMKELKKKKNKTENVNLSPFEVTPSTSSLQSSSLQPPPYSNLKYNNSLPTFRQWKRQTQKSVSVPLIQATPSNPNPMPSPSTNNLKRKNFQVGKNKTNKKVGIFLKNKTMKQNVESSIIEWKSQNMKTMKNKLKKSNLIRYGTCAPNELLREIYVSSELCGNIQNSNGKNLVHNYLESN
jgi:hypothetical protein